MSTRSPGLFRWGTCPGEGRRAISGGLKSRLLH